MPVLDFDGIEDVLIKAIEELDLFDTVDSAGRSGDLEDISDFKNYPAASTLFVAFEDTGNKSRPVLDVKFAVIVQNRNVAGEREAASDTYQLLIAVRDLIHGKRFNIDNIDVFACESAKLTDYKNGVITYTLIFGTRLYLTPVPVT